MTDTVYISESPSVHIKAQQYDWILRVSKGQCVFELFNKAGDDKEMYIRITNDYGKAIGPRKFQIDISPDVHLHSKVAVLSQQGKWRLPFNGKYVVPSQKNAVILDSNDQPVILVGKIENPSLEIETIKEFTPIQLFVIGIVSFLCPI